MGELPKVFANKIEREVGNNKTVSYGSDTKLPSKNEDRKSDLSIHDKIKNIFNSPKYVYKADVIIEMNGEKISKELIGYNRDYIMTLDDERIPVSKVDDIYFK